MYLLIEKITLKTGILTKVWQAKEIIYDAKIKHDLIFKLNQPKIIYKEQDKMR